MGSLGIRAHESDQGLDLLAVADERYLRGMKYKTFHVKHITELLRSHIMDVVKRVETAIQSVSDYILNELRGDSDA